jgi:hypothetical protein
MNATHRALYTPEFLKAILLRAESVDIMVAASVCRTWKDIIEDSQALANLLLKYPIGPGPLFNISPYRPWHFSILSNISDRLYALRLPADNVEVFMLGRRTEMRLLGLDNTYRLQVSSINGMPEFTFFHRHGGNAVCRMRNAGQTTLLTTYDSTFPTRVNQP